MSALCIPELTGDGVVLRRWRRLDLPAVADASTDPYIVATTSVPAEYSDAEGLAWLQRQENHLIQGSAYSFAISEHPENIALGFVGLFTDPDQCWQAGYWVRPGARGRGIASTALRLATDWAIETGKIRCIEAQIEPWNVASQRVAKRAGYRFERRRSNVEHRGIQRDFLVYVRLGRS